jgi:hypothetical protein
MRRAGLLIAGVFLATGAGVALASPASAAGTSVNHSHPDCGDNNHGYQDHHWNRHHHRWHMWDNGDGHHGPWTAVSS